MWSFSLENLMLLILMFSSSGIITSAASGQDVFKATALIRQGG